MSEDIEDYSSSDSDSEGEPSTDFDVHIFSWQSIDRYKKVTNVTDYIVIADEAHSMQSMASNRTKEALQLMYPDR